LEVASETSELMERDDAPEFPENPNLEGMPEEGKSPTEKHNTLH